MTDDTQLPVVTVRAASPFDLDAVKSLLSQADLPVAGLEEQFGAGYAVAEADGRIVAAEGVERYGKAGLLRSAVVANDWRGRGLGLRLTVERIDWARNAGLEEVWLLTTTAADFFPRFGFERAERAEAPAELRNSTEFREACPASAVAMRLRIS